MIIGHGQIANYFKYKDIPESWVIFASGVSNSSSIIRSEFEREENLIIKVLKEYPDHLFIYFSSCFLANEATQKIEYYSHKLRMERLIKQSTENFLVVRIPQIFSYPTKRSTIINFLYFSILERRKFKLNNLATRYLLDLEDLYGIVQDLARWPSRTFHIANPYKYQVTEIVQIIEEITNIKARFSTFSQIDGYELDLEDLSLLSISNREGLSGQFYFEHNMNTYHNSYLKKISC